MATAKLDDTFESVRKSKSKKRKHKEANVSIQSDSVFETPGKTQCTKRDVQTYKPVVAWQKCKTL